MRLKNLLLTFLMILVLGFVIGCSSDSADSDEGGTDESATTETSAAEEEPADDATEDDETDEGAASDDQTGEDIELPSVIPSDVPLPDDAEVTAYGDEEDQGSINISTSVALADLEALYDDYFNEHPQSDEVEKDFYEEEDHDLLSYTTGNDDHLFLIMVTDYGDLVTVHIRYLIY